MYRKFKKNKKKMKDTVILQIILFMSVACSACGQLQEVSFEEITKQSEQASVDGSEKIYVYVSGEVESPGVYVVSKDARLYQVIDIAGGMTKSAKKESLNLAETMYDGQQVHIPSRKEYKKMQRENDGVTVQSDPSQININTATVEELKQLSGIGESKALMIIQYRQENGGFQSIDEIKNVTGIGESTFEKIRLQITVG